MKLSASQRKERRNRARNKKELALVMTGAMEPKKRHIQKLAKVFTDKIMELSSEKIVSVVKESSPNQP